MKIAVITDDGKTISRHFGRAHQYLVFTVEDGRIVRQELREKAGHHTFAPHQPTADTPAGPHGFDPASRNRHAQMLDTIQDCQAVLAGGMGLGMQQNLVEVDIRPVLTDLHDIQEAVQAFIEGRLAQRPELAH